MSDGAPRAMQVSETQERFLRDVALRLPLERVVELHVFPAIRQGANETGLAVIAARRAPPDAAAAAGAPAEGDAAASAAAASGPPPRVEDASADADERHPTTAEAPERARPASPSLADRHTVFSARYRLTLKGPDRGKWEVDVVEEADAPLVTVDAVVRGVQRRAGEGAEPERYTAEQLRALLDSGEPAGVTGGSAAVGR